MRGYDALVVGGGIVGAACARELRAAGLHVAICERRDSVGGGATAAGMGHLAVMDDSEAQFALTRYSQELWRELSAGLGEEAEYLPCGSLWVAADDEEMEEVRRKYAFYSSRGVQVEILGAEDVARAEPNLRPGLAGGLLLPDDAVCYPPAAAMRLAEGVEALYGVEVVGLTASGVELGDGSVLYADAIVLATGADIVRLVPDAPVFPRKGHLAITDRYPGFLHHQIIELGYLKSAHSLDADSVAFNAQPRASGQVLIGSSRQFGVEDPGVEPETLGRMLARAVEYMPGLAGLSAIRAWTGFRAATPDKLPLIGMYPGWEGVYLATGHEGLGISTSLATGRLLADAIVGRESAIPRGPYEPARFVSSD